MCEKDGLVHVKTADDIGIPRWDFQCVAKVLRGRPIDPLDDDRACGVRRANNMQGLPHDIVPFAGRERRGWLVAEFKGDRRRSPALVFGDSAQMATKRARLSSGSVMRSS